MIRRLFGTAHPSKIPAVVVLIILFIYGLYDQSRPKISTLATVSERVQGVMDKADEIYALDTPVPKDNCIVNGPLPDHECTPGAVFPNATKEIICVKGYTKKVRNVSVSKKKSVYAKYGISYPQATGTYEMDHLIPLALGGSNDVANLFPEAGSPTPGFHEKDLVEVYLYKEMCAGRIELASAQKQIANDWLAVYNELTRDQITELRNQFSSWTDKN